MEDAEYYHRRAEQARLLAERAHESPVRRIHLELAGRYAELEQRAESLTRPSSVI